MGFHLMIKAASAKVIGRSHAATKTPCQDAVYSRNLRSRACIALADGAGSKKYSRTGANAIVKESCRIFLNQFDKYYSDITSETIITSNSIVEHFQNILRRRANKRNRLPDDYAATLLFFACDRNKYIAGHIGDGAIIVRFDNKVITLSPPENGEYVNSTYFITDDSASQHLRLYAGEFEASCEVALMSDGTADSLYDCKAHKASIGVVKLLDIFKELPAKKMKTVFKNNLEKVISMNSMDDCSIASLIVIN
jgi:hypothetical protein